MHNWVVGRERSKDDYRNILEEQIPQVNWGMPITYHKDQNPYVRLIPMKDLQLQTPLPVSLISAARKTATAHYIHVFLDSKS